MAIDAIGFPTKRTTNQTERFKLKQKKIILQKKMKKIISLIFFVLFCLFSFTMGNKIAIIHQRLLRDLSNDEIVQVVKTTKQLMSTGSDMLLQIFLKDLQQTVYKRRLEKCVKIFGSENICQNNAKFYIWARTLAKRIMSGQSV